MIKPFLLDNHPDWLYIMCKVYNVNILFTNADFWHLPPCTVIKYSLTYLPRLDPRNIRQKVIIFYGDVISDNI